ncbi:unnamed protein product [Larinioides sclopetarius]|uniref:EGF-like domain-containing protein n=1 Tax=Larinioides sclopetarius TaxID=280406 RepID=A0AAV2BV78_9ARAC
MRLFYYFAYLLVVSAFVYIPGACTDVSVNLPPSDNSIHPLNEENTSLDLINAASVQGEMCNYTNPCQNDGICSRGQCSCPKDYSGPRCETPTWCTWGRCGYGSDVECVWNRIRQEGYCRCTKRNYHYLSKDRKCHECDCGGHGSCQEVDDMLVCKCNVKYALKASKCESCDCGPWSEGCSFDSNGEKKCQCPRDYASKTKKWSEQGATCEYCYCGESGRCSWDGEEKLCDCDDGYRLFNGKCKKCRCGQFGVCTLSESGEKKCSCDDGYAEVYGECQECDCNFTTRRTFGVNCTFVDGLKNCICPPGFVVGLKNCEDINECYTSRPCPANALCINKPGTFECKCESGYKPIRSSLDLKLSRCEETQWRQATIALGVILSIGIIWISCYIMKHKSSS